MGTSAVMQSSFLVVVVLALACFYLCQGEEESRHISKGKSEGGSHILQRERRSPRKSEKKRAGKGKKKRAGKGKKKSRKLKRKGKKNRKAGSNRRKNKGAKNAGNKIKKGGKRIKTPGKNTLKRKGKKVQKIKEIKRKVKISKKGRKSTKQTPNKGVRKRVANNLIGYHCEYVDLCLIDRMSTTGCGTGQKFVIKTKKGTRRQFLMIHGAKVIAFLDAGKKITDCGGNLTDVTSNVKCKTVPGAIDVKLQRQNVTTAAAAATTAAPAAPTTAAPTTAAPPPPAPATPAAPMTDSMPELSAGQIHCPCPTRTCFTTITSTGNSHKIQCGTNTFTVPCGGPLMGSKLGIIINIIDVFEHNLCTTNTYVTLIHDLVWMCRDLNVGADDSCETATLMPTSPSPTPTPTPAPAPAVTTTAASAVTTTTASVTTTTVASVTTTTVASVTTTTAASVTTTTVASAVTTTATSG